MAWLGWTGGLDGANPLGFEKAVCLSELLTSLSAGYLGKSTSFSAVSLQIPAHWAPG